MNKVNKIIFNDLISMLVCICCGFSITFFMDTIWIPIVAIIVIVLYIYLKYRFYTRYYS